MVWSSLERTAGRHICQFALSLVLLLLVGTMVFAQPTRPNNRLSLLAQRVRGSRVPGRIDGTLIPARFGTVRDTKGFYWTIKSDGSVHSSSSSGFRSAQSLTIDRASFSSTAPLMTKGQEYVLRGSVNGFRVSRRVKLMVNEGYVRYLDSITSLHRGRRSPRVVLSTTLGFRARAVLTDKAKPFVVGKSGLKTKAAVIIQRRSAYPMIIQYWSGNESGKLAVKKISSSSIQYQWAFRINLRRKQTLTVATAIALRPNTGAPDVRAIRTMMKPFTEGNFLNGVPPSVRRTIAHGGGRKTIETPASGQLSKIVDKFAARWQIDRKADTLVVDDETMLIGKVEASNLKVVTRYGTANIPFAEVAMIRGGNRQGTVHQVHLRNGEVLVGDTRLAGATLHTTAGIPVKLSMEQFHTLVLARKPADGKPTKEMKLLVQTQSGNRFALRDKPAFELNAATAWGRVKVPLDRLTSLVMLRKPYPMQLVFFRDGSKLKTLLSGSAVKIGSLRFGAISLTPITVSSITRIAATKAKTTSAPHFRLTGGNLLVGTFADKTLRIRTFEGTTVVKSAEIESIEADSGKLKVTTADQESVAGTPVDDIVAISALGRIWKVPSRHLLGFVKPKQKPDAKSKKTRAR